jgi:hypothetical protein
MCLTGKPPIGKERCDNRVHVDLHRLTGMPSIRMEFAGTVMGIEKIASAASFLTEFSISVVGREGLYLLAARKS